MNVSILGIVSPAGSQRKKFCNNLKSLLEKEYKFKVVHVKLNELILDQGKEPKGANKIEITRSRIRIANDIRKNTDNEVFGYFGALKAISKITDISDEKQRTIIILDQFKRTEEINCLKNIFGKCFFTIGVLASETERISELTQDDDSLKATAEDLIAIDENEGDFFKNGNNFDDIKISEDAKKYGQQMAKCILKCDVLFDHSFDKNEVMRFIDLLLGHPYTPPNKDEYFLNFAFVASLKALDLSRQVGAVIVDKYGELLSIGYNEVNKFGGGPYEGINKEDKNDFVLGYDPNKRIINKIKKNISEKLSTKLEGISEVNILKILNTSMIEDLTEFHRATHAEMNALISALRVGTSVKDATLYCTTYPCHNCCKHIISSGIKKIVYLEPYKKSHAEELHEHEITYSISESSHKVLLKSFYGITHNRFKDLFSVGYSSGASIERKDSKSDKVIEFPRKTRELRYQLNSKTIRKFGKILFDTLTKDSKFDIESYQEFSKSSGEAA